MVLSQAETNRRFLICLKNVDDDEKVDTLAGITEDDWHSLFSLAQRYNMTGMLAWQLRGLLETIEIPKEIIDQLRSSLWTGASRNLLLTQELSKVLRGLEDAAIPVIVLKGAHLATLVYEDISLRQMGDIDLLIRKPDLFRCDRVLTGLGYGPSNIEWIQHEYSTVHHHLPGYSKPGAPMIEVHWSIVHPDSFYNIEIDGLWQRAHPVEITKCKVFVLAPEDLLMHLCLHACHNQFINGPRALVDIAETVQRYQPDIDWNLLNRLAIKGNARKSVFLLLFLAADLLNALIPTEILTNLKPESFNPSTSALAYEKIFGSQSPSRYLTSMVNRESTFQKLKILLSRIFLPRLALAKKYGIHTDSPRLYWYYWRRFKDLVTQYHMVIWHWKNSRVNQDKLFGECEDLFEWLYKE